MRDDPDEKDLTDLGVISAARIYKGLRRRGSYGVDDWRTEISAELRGFDFGDNMDTLIRILLATLRFLENKNGPAEASGNEWREVQSSVTGFVNAALSSLNQTGGMAPKDDRPSREAKGISQASAVDEAVRWFFAAQAMHSAGALDLAAEAFENAIRAESDHEALSVLLDRLGHVRWEQKRYEEAVRAFWEAIFYNNDFPGPWHDIARIRMELGDSAVAVDLMRQAIRRSPTRAKYWMTLGVAQMRLGQLAEAITTLEHHVELDHQSARGWGNLSIALRRRRRLAEARRARDKAIEIGGLSIKDLAILGAGEDKTVNPP